MCTCGMCVNVHVCMWAQDWCPVSSSIFLPYILRKSLWLNWNIQFQLVWLTSLLQGLGNAPTCLEFTSRLPNLPDFYVGSEMWTLILTLFGECFTCGSHHPRLFVDLVVYTPKVQCKLHRDRDFILFPLYLQFLALWKHIVKENIYLQNKWIKIHLHEDTENMFFFYR